MLAPGDRIGDWVVESQLGAGAIGAVWRCHHTVTEKLRAAVKVYQLSEIPQGERWFVTEVEALSRLRHPTIVGIRTTSIDAEKNVAIIAMELVEGETLQAMLTRGPLAVEEFRKVFSAVAEALAFAHEHRIYHRDIKPANIMVRPDGTPMIVDFGVAADLDAGNDIAGVGTPPYLPPEWFRRGGNADPAQMDVYALGVVMNEALLAKRAFPGIKGGDETRFAHFQREKLRATALDPGEEFSAAVRNLIAEMTDPDPRVRRVTMKEIGPRVRAMDLRPPGPQREWAAWIAGGFTAAIIGSLGAAAMTWWWIQSMR